MTTSATTEATNVRATIPTSTEVNIQTVTLGESPSLQLTVTELVGVSAAGCLGLIGLLGILVLCYCRYRRTMVERRMMVEKQIIVNQFAME